MEELYVLHEQALDSSDPHGYFCVSDSELVTDPTKRFFLSECIHQIYIMNGNTIPIMSMQPEYNETVIWHNLNIIMETSSLTSREILLQRVKRRLFRECKRKRRKCQKPRLNSSKLSEGVYFKASRYILGIRKVRRNYLHEAKENIFFNDFHQKRKFTKDPVDDVQWINSNNLSLFQVYQQAINEICQYQSNMAHHHSQQGHSWDEDCRVSRRAKKLEEMLNEYNYRELSIANDRYLDGTVRAILYMKNLLRLMPAEEHDGNLYM